jgi:hypothetical protein
MQDADLDRTFLGAGGTRRGQGDGGGDAERGEGLQ